MGTTKKGKNPTVSEDFFCGLFSERDILLESLL